MRKTKVSSQKQLLVNNSTPTYKYLIKQVFLEDKIPLTSTKKIKVFENEFIKRGNWVKFNENSPAGETIDFLYTDGKYLVDKSLYKYNKILTTFVNMADDNHSISDKYNLIENLKKTNINPKHLLDQYHLNMYEVYKNKTIIEKYKPLFDKYNQFKKEDNNITTHNKEYQESNKNIARCSLSGHLIGIFIIIVFLFSIMYRSYTLVKTNKIKRTDFMSLYFIVTSILGSLIYLSDLFQDLAIEYNNLLDIEKISGLNLFNDEPYINPEIKYPKIKTDSLITVHDLEYRYPKSDTSIINGF